MTIKGLLISFFFFTLFFPLVHILFISSLIAFRALFNKSLMELLITSTVYHKLSARNYLSVFGLFIISLFPLSIFVYLFVFLFLKTINDYYGDYTFIVLSVIYSILFMTDIVFCFVIRPQIINKIIDTPPVSGIIGIPVFKNIMINYFTNIYSNRYYWVFIAIYLLIIILI